MKAEEWKRLQEMPVAELMQERMSLLKAQFNMRLINQSGKLTQTHLLRAGRRDLARVNTLLRQKMNAARSAAAAQEGEAK